MSRCLACSQENCSRLTPKCSCVCHENAKPKQIPKKPLNVAQRVEILLREGVDKPECWSPVHGYKEPEMSKMDFGMWYDEHTRLLEHHLKETNFLLDVIKEMREQILSLSDDTPKVNNDGKIIAD